MEKSRHSRKRIYLIAGYLFFIAVLFFLLLYGFANNRGTPENKQEPKVENAGAPIVVNRPISPMTIEDALFYYAASGNIEALKLIFLSDINVDTKDNDGDTPLNVACICGNIQSVRYLFSL